MSSEMASVGALALAWLAEASSASAGRCASTSVCAPHADATAAARAIGTTAGAASEQLQPRRRSFFFFFSLAGRQPLG